MSKLGPLDCIDCQNILKHWVEFQLVDEQGEPIVNMPYRLRSRGNQRDERRGVTDGFGVIREETFPPHPVRLYIGTQELANEMERHPLREKRGEEASVVKPKAEAEGHQYRYVTIGQIKVETLSATPIVYDVPFSERYTRVEFIDSKAGDNKQGNTQLFYVASEHDLIVSWRGTTNMTDAVTDATYQPLGLDCDEKALCSGFIHSGKVHKGFWEAFSLVEKLTIPSDKKKEVFSDVLDLAASKRLFICGHSLGGALALLHSAQLKEHNPCLYSYGMPRTLTRSAVQELTAITHYRHVNEDDPVLAVPPEKNLDNWFYRCWGPLGYLFSPIELLDFTDSGKVYLHHGKIVHFCKITLVIEWLEERNPSNHVRLRTTLPTKTKLYLIPSLNPETENNLKEAGNIQKRFFQQISEADKAKWFPLNEKENKIMLKRSYH